MTNSKLNDFELDKKSKLPYYYQVYTYLLNKIENNKLKEGDQLPNELVLCDKFQVSRTTIREALRELKSNGYITRGRGQGTFISIAPVESAALQKVSSIVDELKEKGIKTETKVLSREVISPSEKLQKKLNINSKKKVLYIKRLMIADNEPMYITKAYFPYNIFKNIEDKYLVNISFTRIVEENFKINILHRKRVLEPDIPNKETIKLLEIKKDDKKVMHYLQTFWTFKHNSEKRIIYFEEYFGPKSRFVFESE